MKSLFSLAATALGRSGVSASADGSEAAARAQLSAGRCLALIDGARYGPSWDEASSFLRSVVPKAKWQEAMTSVRAPFGGVRSRSVKSATFTRTLAGMPDGEYVVIDFETRFEARTATETVAPVLEEDGVWRVAAYVIA